MLYFYVNKLYIIIVIKNKMESEKLIMGIWNPLLDISAECTTEFIEKYGLQLGHATLAEEKHKELFDELWNSKDVKLTAGGSGMNVIRCANFMLQNIKPNSCIYFGSICDDERGIKLKECIEKEGLEAEFSIAEDSYTGACGVVLHNKEISLIADLGASLKYKVEHLESHFEKIKSCKIIYGTGFFITSNHEALIKLVDWAVENNKIFSFSFSAVFVVIGFQRVWEYIVSNSDFVFGNQDECSIFCKAHGVESEDIKEIAKYIAEFPRGENKKSWIRTALVIQGLNPATVATHNFETGETVVKEYSVEAVPKSEIVDMNSAGDSFTGGFLAAIALGHNEETAITAGYYWTKYIIKVSGCSFPRPLEFEFPELP